MVKLPKDCPARKISTRARSIVPYKLNSELWEWHEQTGTDHGTDMIIEYIENDEYRNDKIECQIKGTKSLKILSNGLISFELEIKTINYALGCSNAFVLFVVDVNTENVYYLPVQDYFIKDKTLFEKVKKNKSNLSVHLSQSSILDKNDINLKQFAKKTYVGGPSTELHEYKIPSN